MRYTFEIGSAGVCEKHGVEREVRVKLGMPYNTGIWECPKCEEEHFDMLRQMEYRKWKEEREKRDLIKENNRLMKELINLKKGGL